MCWSAVCPYLELEGVSCNRGRASDVPLPTAYGSQYYSGHAMNPKHMNRWSPRRLWWGKGAPLIAAWTVTAWNRRNKMWQLQWCFLKEREGGSSNNNFHMITVSFWLYSLFRSLNHRNSINFFFTFPVQYTIYLFFWTVCYKLERLVVVCYKLAYGCS